MNTTLLERLRSFQIPAESPVPEGHFIVARLEGVDFAGIIASPEFGFSAPFDVKFSKLMIRSASHLLGGDPCGHFGYVEHLELSLLLDRREVSRVWPDASDLQAFLVALSSSKMSLLLEDEALFTCRLFAFNSEDLVLAYFVWRQQEVYLAAVDRHCAHVLAREGASVESIAKLLEDLGPLEKEEILRQNGIEYAGLPAWQRRGVSVSLGPDGKVVVNTNLGREAEYRTYLQQFLR